MLWDGGLEARLESFRQAGHAIVAGLAQLAQTLDTTGASGSAGVPGTVASLMGCSSDIGELEGG